MRQHAKGKLVERKPKTGSSRRATRLGRALARLRAMMAAAILAAVAVLPAALTAAGPETQLEVKPATNTQPATSASSGQAGPARAPLKIMWQSTSTDPNQETDDQSFSDSDFLDLLDAAEKGDLAAVQKAVEGHGTLIRRTYSPFTWGFSPASNLNPTDFYPWWAKRNSAGLLHAAAAGGQKAVVEYLLGKGADANMDAGSEWRNCARTPLHYIAAPPGLAEEWNLTKSAETRQQLRRTAYAEFKPLMERRREVAALLLAKGAAINAGEPNWPTPLAVAAMENNRVIADFLLQRGAKLDLHSAAYLDLVNRAAEIVARDRQALTSRRHPETSLTPLEIAASLGHANMVRKLIELGANPDGDGEYTRPIQHAVTAGSAETVAVLLKAGADANLTANTNDYPPLCSAADAGDLDIVRLLVEAGAHLDASGPTGNAPLFMAAYRGHLQVIDYLVDKGADINYDRNDGRWTPLLGAVASGKVDAARRLLDKGAALDAFSAAGLGMVEPLQRMLRADPGLALRRDGDSDPRCRSGWGTPLYWAARYNKLDAAKALLDAGASGKTLAGIGGRARRRSRGTGQETARPRPWSWNAPAAAA